MGLARPPCAKASTTSLGLLSLALVLLASPPGVEASRAARRRHPIPDLADYSPSLASAGLTREDSSIPGVSIWTSKTAASASERAGYARDVLSRRKGGRGGGNGDASRVEASRTTSRSFIQAREWAGDSQDDRGDPGDADVEPPARGTREEQGSVAGEEYRGVVTTEEEDDNKGLGDAAPGRLLEEGGGSDSDEDETDSEHTEDEGSDSYEDADDSESEEAEQNAALGSASRGWGRGAVGGGSDSSARTRRGGTSSATIYEDDEDACFARLKELWEDRVILPLSRSEIEELSEGVKAEQKKLTEAAPTEWNSGLSRIGGSSGSSSSSSGGASGRSKKTGSYKGGDGGGEAVEGGGEGVGGGGGGGGGEDSSLDLLYRLLLAEMYGNGSSGGLNNRWIERDSLLQLRGAATLAHNPEYLRHTANLPRVTRGVRLVAPEATHSMQEALARSLGHSTGSKVVLLDGKALEAVRGRALSEGVPKEQLTSRHLASALIEVAGEDGSPFVLFLKDKGSAVFKSRGLCQRLTEEMKNESSRVLFLLSTASDPSVPGNSPDGPGDEAAAQEAPQQGGGMFGNSLQWPRGPSNTPPGQSKRPMQDDGTPKKNYIFLQQNAPEEGDGGGGYFGGRSPRGGRGGRSGGRGQSGQSFGKGAPGPPVPPQMLEQLLREAMKNMKSAQEDNNNSGDENGGGDGSSAEQGGGDAEGGGAGGGGDGRDGIAAGDIPPGLLEALSEALNDDEFKRTLEQIGKQLGKDSTQGFSIMFSSGAVPPGQGGAEGGGGGRGGGGDGAMDETSPPWGASGPGGNPGKGGSWQGSSSLSWLTNLRKGIMTGDENMEAAGEAKAGGDADTSGGGGGSDGRGGGGEAEAGGGRVGGGGGDDGGEGGGRKADTRRGVDVAPSGSELRAFVNQFEDIAVNPPQDAVLRQHWDTWVKEDVGKHNMHQNKQVLMTALRRNMLACPELQRLDSLLARHRLTEAETGQVVLTALKVELSKAAAAREEVEGGASNQPLVAPRRTAKGRLVISRQSMETAFAAVCKAYVPRPGQPMSRTREEVTALAQHDRHEQALVSNVILPKDIGVTYDMIGGLGGAKELLRQCITYPLRFPHLYNEGIAKEAVKGVLLFGPPGTGKTMLAKAVATEGGATFLSVDASVIENKWLGESEKNARAVFTLARRLAPCVIFIDEVDSVLSSREKYDDTTHGTLTSVKTTLMQEWDGLRTGGDRVVVIASTNRPFDLDEAVLRRLPRRILVDLPDAETREEILKVSMAQNRVDASVNFTAITAELEGFTGSDIKEVCREAVVRIAHEKAHELDKAGLGGLGEEIDLTAQLRPVTMDDFAEARKKLTASVSEKGRELSRVWEWNEEYGEVKKKRPEASAHHLSMYL